jgi:hypothetical protein
MKLRALFSSLAILVVLSGVATGIAPAGASPSFSVTTLSRPNGDSEPAISIGSAGVMAITGLPWVRPTLADFATDLWTGSFGSVPGFQGGIDTGLVQPGSTVIGAEDADVDIGSTGRLHATTLIGLVNRPLTSARFGVSAITCPNPASAGFSVMSCSAKIIDTTQADRQWVTSDGPRVWIAYHDSAASSLIHVQRSDDDGFTWHKVGDPIVGQGGATGDATFNNLAGPIVADPFTHNVYDVYVAGEPSIQKGTTFFFNNIFVSRSTDGGVTWKATRVFHAPLNTRLNNVFPALAADPTNGYLYAAWTDLTGVFVSRSTDQGLHWSPAQKVSAAAANTTVMPWVAASKGIVDVVFYGTTAASKDDPGAVWNVYLAQSMNGGVTYAQSMVSPVPNHVGVICTNGTGCPDPDHNRTLLDLFEVAIDPASGRAAIIYTDDAHATFTQDGETFPLPQLVLAQET